MTLHDSLTTTPGLGVELAPITLRAYVRGADFEVGDLVMFDHVDAASSSTGTNLAELANPELRYAAPGDGITHNVIAPNPASAVFGHSYFGVIVAREGASPMRELPGSDLACPEDSLVRVQIQGRCTAKINGSTTTRWGLLYASATGLTDSEDGRAIGLAVATNASLPSGMAEVLISGVSPVASPSGGSSLPDWVAANQANIVDEGSGEQATVTAADSFYGVPMWRIEDTSGSVAQSAWLGYARNNEPGFYRISFIYRGSDASQSPSALFNLDIDKPTGSFTQANSSNDMGFVLNGTSSSRAFNTGYDNDAGHGIDLSVRTLETVNGGTYYQLDAILWMQKISGSGWNWVLFPAHRPSYTTTSAGTDATATGYIEISDPQIEYLGDSYLPEWTTQSLALAAKGTGEVCEITKALPLGGTPMVRLEDTSASTAQYAYLADAGSGSAGYYQLEFWMPQDASASPMAMIVFDNDEPFDGSSSPSTGLDAVISVNGTNNQIGPNTSYTGAEVIKAEKVNLDSDGYMVRIVVRAPKASNGNWCWLCFPAARDDGYTTTLTANVAGTGYVEIGNVKATRLSRPVIASGQRAGNDVHTGDEQFASMAGGPDGAGQFNGTDLTIASDGRVVGHFHAFMEIGTPPTDTNFSIAFRRAGLDAGETLPLWNTTAGDAYPVSFTSTFDVSEGDVISIETRGMDGSPSVTFHNWAVTYEIYAD